MITDVLHMLSVSRHLSGLTTRPDLVLDYHRFSGMRVANEDVDVMVLPFDFRAIQTKAVYASNRAQKTLRIS